MIPPEIKPDFALGHNLLGVAYAKSGDKTDAIHEFGEAVRLDPEFSEAQNSLKLALESSKVGGAKSADQRNPP